MGAAERYGILVGGGPAPGINSVIGAATIRSVLDGVDVLGIYDGFRTLMEGERENVESLTIDKVSRLHFSGGSYLRTSRANPTNDPASLDRVVETLHALEITGLITIGGDDTAFSATKVAERAAGRVRVVHVPKTIDNDIALPPDCDTFGYQTARHVGVRVVKSLMVDAQTTSRWFFAVAMGRKAGHLALGIGKAAATTITLIPEEFGDGQVRLHSIIDTIAGSIIKRLADGRPDGVAVVAEGVVLGLSEGELAVLDGVERDDHGHVRLAEVDVGGILKTGVKARLAEFGISPTIVAKNIGYELRCADPIPLDLEYTRDLGFCASRALSEGRNSVLITMQGGSFVPVPLSSLLDPETGRTGVRMVDTGSTRYKIARRYMIRLRDMDLKDAEKVSRLAGVCGVSVERFVAEFEHVALPPAEF
ncbi:MAG: 6-phosphofructokinase [Gemmatimonadota bacterium]|nr:MAG: 6-phosphofructokinase [Gemmatimonadota bacterium]